MLTVALVPMVSSIVNLVFAGLIYSGYSSTTLTRANDDNFGYWYALPIMSSMDFMVTNNLVPAFINDAKKD